MVRKSMVKWYITLILINIFFLFLPQTQRVPLTLNRPLLSMTAMLFTGFLVPNNLSIDAIGGEKYHKTVETLFSTPLEVKSIFSGKTFFILLLGMLYLILTTLQNNILLKLIYKKTYMDAGLTGLEISGFYILAVLSIVLIALIGSATSLVSNNLKISGYLISVVNIVLVATIYKVIQLKNTNQILIFIVLLFLLCFTVFTLVTRFLTKQHVMKYIK